MYHQTKLWKGIDIIGQLACIIIPLVMGEEPSDGFFVLLFALGGWQLTSFVIQLIWDDVPWKVYARRVYGKILLMIPMVAVIGMVVKVLLGYLLYGMLFIGPVLGFLYLTISIVEWLRIQRLATNSELSYHGSTEELEDR